MSKLPFVFALACWLLFCGKRKITAQQARREHTYLQRKCANNDKIEVVFKVNGKTEKPESDLGCISYLPDNWMHILIWKGTESLDGYRVGCYVGNETDEEVEVRCPDEQVTAIQPRSFPKKNCVLHRHNGSYWFKALVKNDGVFICGVANDERTYNFSFTIKGVKHAGSHSVPSALSGNTDSSSGTSAASVLGGPQEKVRTGPDDSVSIQGVSGAAAAGRQEGVAATSPLGSAGSFGDQRDDAARDPDVLKQLSEQHRTGEIGESGKGLREGVNVSDLLAQAASHSRFVRKYHFTLLSFFSLPALLPGA
ncbi:hypothetical protein, conserved in T. vivax [Trypanosoma vivax Y486]|uniref:Uncharacterized protein n=1 Tax=Trypanosoma vivax (strain Y486) TaxID=1055687 RepID=F9WR10_TRYVY|nr:hypothetical protein, conserved in T. vivax [Trypanosoma vivax Y486]|eukprot:CCD19993.1 hypothetical protein, conserved in T. vivax [Trypanosoma vivax Y486]